MNHAHMAQRYPENEAPMNFSIERAEWSHHEEELRAIRTAVFIDEQFLPADIEWDGEDEQSVHFLARDDSGSAIGCVRLMTSGQISSLSVLDQHRNHGIGKALLARAEEEARDQGMSEIFLHAQTHATSFYESTGFTVTGGIFLEGDIPHRQMVKGLD